MFFDVRNWVIGGAFLGVLVVFGLVLMKVVDDTRNARDEQWKAEITARNIKYHNEMMLKDGKIRRREEEIHTQLEEQRVLREANSKLIAEFAARIPLSEACSICRVSREHFQLPTGTPSDRSTSPADSGKGRAPGPAPKGNVPKSRKN